MFSALSCWILKVREESKNMSLISSLKSAPLTLSPKRTWGGGRWFSSVCITFFFFSLSQTFFPFHLLPLPFSTLHHQDSPQSSLFLKTNPHFPSIFSSSWVSSHPSLLFIFMADLLFQLLLLFWAAFRAKHRQKNSTCSGPNMGQCCEVMRQSWGVVADSRWALPLPSLVFSPVQLFVLLSPSCCLICSFIHALMSELSDGVVDQDVLALLPWTLCTVNGSCGRAECPRTQKHTWSSSISSHICVRVLLNLVILVHHVCFPPPCRVPASCGGLCSSPGGFGGLWKSSSEFLTYIKPPRMNSAGAEGSKGNTLMMLVLFMWVPLQGKK